jgi:N-methylhydantoinase A
LSGGDYVIGVDIGGTFTDCAVVDGDGTVTIAKAPSSPPDFETGFFAAIGHAARMRETTLEEIVGGARGVYHGCTVGTNALVEDKVKPVGLITTRGHADSIFSMQSGRRMRSQSPETIAHVAAHTKPAPLVPRRLVREVDERVTFDGNALVALNEGSVSEAIEALLAEGVDAFAISLLWSVANPDHELRIEQMVRAAAPEAFISVAHRIAPRTGEYERTVATVVNALVGPPTDAYLAVVEERLLALGYERPLQIMGCSGGLITSEEARRLPVQTIGSGPVAGVIGSRALTLASEGESASVLTADMGGTTFDVGVIHQGDPLSRSTSWHDQYEFQTPTVDVRSIGSGGGSLIRHDPISDTLKVGPESAGALPGPACYGRGGTQATVSDADLVLGYFSPVGFAGGEMTLDAAAAETALGEAGEPLGFDARQAAVAAVRIVDNQMADAIRLASVQQGHDPRRFDLYAFGGGGAVHGAAIARELGMRRVVVPLSDLASGWSAFGVAGSEALIIEQVSVGMTAPFDAAALNERWASLEGLVAERMESQGIPPERIRLSRFAEMRYPLQINQIHVPAPGGLYDDAVLEDLIAAYEREYARLFGEGTGYSEAGYAITSLRVEGRAAITEHQLSPRAEAAESESPAPTEEREVTFVGPATATVATAIYDGTELSPGVRIGGPAVVSLPNTSVVVPGDMTVSVDSFGSLVLEFADQEEAR